ncbi:MAG: 4-alpha-glucanotransferase [Paludibacteraceae bacterium]|nr:4-alpha-glucanotransferase [Paludibacteraceae bacterium]
MHLQLEYRTQFGQNLWVNIRKSNGSYHALPMYTHDGIIWHVDIQSDSIPADADVMTYYYSVEQDGRILRTEWCLRPHRLNVSRPSISTSVITDAWADEPADLRLTGTLIPLFSLRSQRSFGIGDFGDLRRMVDWVSLTGQNVLQLLPINDTTASYSRADSYPYSCVSVFALHPVYIDLNALRRLPDNDVELRYEQLRSELNALPAVDYERVIRAKLQYLRQHFEAYGRQVLTTPDFRRFLTENASWLAPYAQYSTLRDCYQTPDFSSWPDHQTFDAADIGQLTNPRCKAYRDVSFWYYVQYLLDRQMCDAHEYARSHDVVLKGDIPIGVNRCSCDVWQRPGNFCIDGQAGAPPDDFSDDGQNWGFPTYNWDAMRVDNYRWWTDRLRHMSRYFDAYRIDHVLGFFRIWEIPVPVRSGLLGQFAPAQGFSTDELVSRGIRPETIRRTTCPALFGQSVKSPSTDCLFLHDHRNTDLLHPRILAHRTTAYTTLSADEQRAYDALYEDFFYHRNEDLWYDRAINRLPHLTRATRMLCCAEDLGMVPECVGRVMSRLGILSLEIESMPKQYGLRFGHTEQNPHRSVCVITSHDMPTLRQWWDDDADRARDYYANVLHQDGPAPHPLPADVADRIISRHVGSPSMICIISLQDWFATDETLRRKDFRAERINNPADPDNYWQYRMHIDLDTLVEHRHFNEHVRSLACRQQTR